MSNYENVRRMARSEGLSRSYLPDLKTRAGNLAVLFLMADVCGEMRRMLESALSPSGDKAALDGCHAHAKSCKACTVLDGAPLRTLAALDEKAVS